VTHENCRVLVVDREAGVRQGLLTLLERQGSTPIAAATSEEALRLAGAEQPELVLVDPDLPGVSGLALIEALARAASGALIVVTTGYPSVKSAVETMRAGVFDYLAKPVRSEELILLVKRAFVHLGERELESAAEQEDGFAGLIGTEKEMQVIFETVRRVASAAATVLVQGESGTGKELVARALHRVGKRRAFPFVAIHCSALPGSLLESELFGHEKGAFTGAIRMQKGKFEIADRGTVLLDEVATLDERAQVDLLRVLQEREFTRIGGSEVIRTSARVVATCNENLRQLVEQGRFREDLYYRLNVVRIDLPPLRERPGDLEPLARHFVAKYARANERAIAEIEHEALARMHSWSWPGNVRELENVIERAVVMGSGQTLRLEDLPDELRGAATGAGSPSPDAGPDLRLQPRVEALERQLIDRALQLSSSNRTRAAELLGISERTLRYKIQRHGICVGREAPCGGSLP